MDYANAKIYRIEVPSRPDLLPYYGATCSTLTKRLNGHRNGRRDTRSRDLMECEDVSIVLMEAYPCHNKDELNAREAWWIRNNECCNRNIPDRSEKEYCQLPEIKAKKNERVKAYFKTPAGRAKNREYLRQWRAKKKALTSSLVVPPCDGNVPHPPLQH